MAINRITGVNSGIDVDTVVKESLATEQNKIDKAYQQQKTYEYEQEQLKEIVSQAAEFYDKYLDRLASGNLLSEKSYQVGTFTAKDKEGNTTAKVTAKAYAGADIKDYKVSISQIAEKAATTIRADSSDLQNVINGASPQEGIIAVTMKNSRGENVNAAVDIVIEDGQINMNKTVLALNSALNKKGINVSAKYSEFSRGIVLESGSSGESVSFGVAVKAAIAVEDADLSTLTYVYHSGQNAKGTVTKGTDTIPIDRASNTLLIDDVEFTFNGTSISNDRPDPDSIHDLAETGEDAKNVIIKKESSDGNVVITTQNDDNGYEKSKVIEKKYSSGVTLKTVTTTESGVTSSPTTNVSGNLTHLSTSDSGVTVDTTSVPGTTIITRGNVTTRITGNTTRTLMHDELSDGQAIDVETITTLSGNGNYTNNTTLSQTTKLTDRVLTGSILDGDYKTTITSSDGKKQTIIAHGVDSEGHNIINKYTTESCSDGSSKEKITTYNTEAMDTPLTITTSKSEAITLSGQTDVTDLKDTLVKFVNDYNKIMETINTKLWEKHDSDYKPLTENQKSAMTESQIEAWEKKSKTGLLRSDSDLRRIQSAMKTAMSSLMSGSGLNLESIGIEPVDNYTTKNGMYTIDEAKLTSALENNGQEVRDLFTRKASSDGTDKGGVVTQISFVLKSEVKSSKSSLSERIGFEGTGTETNNTLSNYINKQKKLIKELKSKYTSKETALYNKYSSLETMLEKLSAQSNSLYSMLGLS